MTQLTSRALTLSILLISLAACQTVPEETPTPVAIEPVRTRIVSAPARPRTRVQPQNVPIDETISPIVYENLWEKIADNLSLVHAYSHDDIDEAIQWYVENPRYVERIARRAAPYLFHIVEEVESRNLPLELALLPVVESAFDPTASSAENAVGLWQFMAPTAKSLGLQNDWWFDGRRDPIASTKAALDYLEFLYAEFDNDWLIALAAYNAGEGNVRRTIRRARAAGRPVDFWTLRLPAETRNHVPRLLAIATLVSDPDAFGITFPRLKNDNYLAPVELDFQLDLGVAARMAGLEVELLRRLNPGFLRWATHPDSPQSILLPLENVPVFEASLEGLPADQRVAWDRYQIRSGDTLGNIARRHGTRVDVIQQINGLSGSRIIAGQSLLIPRSSAQGSQPLSTASARGAVSRVPIPTSYRVRRGDTLWDIARRYNLRSEEIAEWNDISLNALLQPGQILVLQPGDSVAGNAAAVRFNYEVVKGDSLDRIARSFDVSIDDLVIWNELDPRDPIYPGQRIRIVSSGAALN